MPGAWEKMPGATSALMLAGAPKLVAQAGQVLWTLTFAAAVIWLIRSKARTNLRNAGIVVASLAASPYVFIYDLAALAVVYPWILADGKVRAFQHWERATLGLACIAPIGVWAVADLTNVQLGPLVFLALMSVIISRAAAVQTGSAPVAESIAGNLLEKRINPVH